MKILKKVNIILAIISLSLVIYHFFIEKIHAPDYALFFYLSVVFLLNGIELTKEGNKGWAGYVQFVAALVCSVAAISDLL
ncbi:hypothetical protein N780_01755 [Pontibacillus chungwhensis BH030062]|uniref:DUF3953 domain-containing protein n=1 Tax=Pontibacillus chungwhensis BH030062 TaxID=1385513 RepID=A0A0A2UVU5_9BACI|nr:hypothetical protein [Pontibacillus chungwhensis]KGP92387.1 hypothetical protein N780_01755 [Pontibacillus chungwhensis BH030062]